MQHRHLNHHDFTLAAIDDIISRGRRSDWAELRRALLNNQELSEKIRQVCRGRISYTYAQRYHFWMHYVKEHSA